MPEERGGGEGPRTVSLRNRLVQDALLAVLVLGAFANQLTGNAWHEVAGAAILAGILIHLAINRRWLAGLIRGGRDARRLVGVSVNLLLLADFVLLMASGIVDSRFLFKGAGFSSGHLVRQLHIQAAYWFLILMAVHLGLHWRMVMAETGRLARKGGLSETNPVWARCLAALTGAGGVYASFDRDIFAKLTGYFSFDYWDFDRHALLFFLEYGAIVGLYAGLSHYAARLIRKGG